MEYILIFISAIFVNNIVLSQFLGICPFLGVSKKVETAMGMSAAVAFVLTIATIVTFLIQKFVLDVFGLGYLQTITFILVIAGLALTNTMLNEFVEKILVHERARKGSQDTTQEIEIYFNFLGRYIPPSLQPVPLTPEEQEELQKKEERKDRLHQNYLKRKASGAQKRYEDKIKAKKKAEMDAKKALIRAEDMKKGVFSTVGQLPKEEPRKGSIAASAAV